MINEEMIARAFSSSVAKEKQQAQFEPPLFPTMLRKMWSGREVQEWINENWKAAPVQQEPNNCAQCKKEYRKGSCVGCPKCAKGVDIAESEFQKPVQEDEGCWKCGEDGGTSCGDPTCGLLVTEDELKDRRITELKAQNKALLDALKLYANRANWLTASTGFAAQYDPLPSVISIDNGDIARAAIAQVEGKK